MDDLRCNSLKCRKSLSLEGSAVVTTCSHIFCIECATSLFSQPQICPACETSLPEPDDAVQTNLSPPDAYKTSVLAGLSPILVLDIASRALNFYTYQVQQESAFQSLVTKNAQERIAVLESQCQNIIREATSEITLLKNRVTVSERDLELERRKVRDLQETHKANSKAYNKLKLNKAQQRALLASGTHNMTGNFVSAAANQPLPSSQFNLPNISRPTSVLQNDTNHSHNNALKGWANTYSGGNSGSGTGGGGIIGGISTGEGRGNSTQPLSNQPGHSNIRPRRSLQNQNQNTNTIPTRRSASSQQYQLPRSHATPIPTQTQTHTHTHSKPSFGQGYFSGSGGNNGGGGGGGGGVGILPIPSSARRNSREFSAGIHAPSDGSGESGSGGAGGTTSSATLKYLGQQNRSKVSGRFRPAAEVF